MIYYKKYFTGNTAELPLTWQNRRLGCCRYSLGGSVWRRPGQRAAACYPVLSHPQKEASWKCTDLWGPAPVAAQMEDDRRAGKAR